MAEILETCCVICRLEFLEADEKTVVTRKGLTTIIKFGNIRNDSVLSLYLANADIDTNLLLVHKECRKRFTDPRKRVTNEVVKNEKAIILHSSQTHFLIGSRSVFSVQKLQLLIGVTQVAVMLIVLQHYHFVQN